MEGWRTDFPMEEEVEDFAGRLRTFVITCDETGLGFTVRAREKEEGVVGGYEFAAYSETTPYNALGRLRQKMYTALATRHISGSPGHYRMLHDRVRGRIAWDETMGTALVVDGILMSLEDLGSLLATHEGWEFELTLIDSLE